MAKISRVTQLIFGSTGNDNGVFGSAQANGGPGTLSNVLSTIMGLPAWLAGWLSATEGASKFPCLEEMNGVNYVTTTQLAYLFQQGIAEYDAGTTYFLDSLCMKPGTSLAYISLADNNQNNALTDAVHWALAADFSGGKLLGAHGQCRMSKSGSNIALLPHDGNKLIIAGTPQVVPSAGVSLAPTGLTASTLYYIYAFMNSGTMTLEASTTGHATDTATGVEIKSGDATRTLVGMVYPTTGPAFTDTFAQRFVLSYFNRRNLAMAGPGGSTATTSNTSTPSELNSAARAEGLTWGDEGIQGQISGYVSLSVAGNVNSLVALNGGTATMSNNVMLSSSGSTNFTNTSITGSTLTAEGYFNLTAVAGNISGGGAATFNYQITGMTVG